MEDTENNTGTEGAVDTGEGLLEGTLVETGGFGEENYSSPDDFPEDLVVEEEQGEQVEGENPDNVETEEAQAEEGEEGATEEAVENEGEEQNDDDIDTYYSDLSESTGLNIDSQEKLESALIDFRDYLEKENEGEGDAFSDLPKELQMAIDVHKNGGDYKNALSAISMDFEAMSDKEVLRQKFYQDNASLVQKDKEFADMKFEKEYDSKYSILNQQFEDSEDRDEFEAENAKEIEYSKKSLQRDVADSREQLEEWKQNNMTFDSVEDKMSDSEQQQILEKHRADASEALENFEGTLLAMDDNPDNDYLVGMSDENKQVLSDILNDPRDFLSETMGFNWETGEINYEQLATVANLLLNVDKIGSSISSLALENENRKTVEGQLENTRPKRPSETTRQPIEDIGLSIGKAIREKLYGNR
jgi:hypothetical protein